MFDFSSTGKLVIKGIDFERLAEALTSQEISGDECSSTSSTPEFSPNLDRPPRALDPQPPNALSLEMQIKLTQAASARLKLSETYPDGTLREAMVEYLMKQYETSQDPAYVDFIHTVLRLKLDYPQTFFIHTYDTSLKSIQILANQRVLLDIPIRCLAQLKPESLADSYSTKTTNVIKMVKRLVNLEMKLSKELSQTIEQITSEFNSSLNDLKESAVAEFKKKSLRKSERIIVNPQSVQLKNVALIEEILKKGTSIKKILDYRISRLSQEIENDSSTSYQRQDQQLQILDLLAAKVSKCFDSYVKDLTPFLDEYFKFTSGLELIQRLMAFTTGDIETKPQQEGMLERIEFHSEHNKEIQLLVEDLKGLHESIKKYIENHRTLLEKNKDSLSFYERQYLLDKDDSKPFDETDCDSAGSSQGSDTEKEFYSSNSSQSVPIKQTKTKGKKKKVKKSKPVSKQKKVDLEKSKTGLTENSSTSSASVSSSATEVKPQIHDLQLEMMKVSACCSWKKQVEAFADQQLDEKQSYSTKKYIQLSKMESIEHAFYSLVGLERLMRAIDRNEWSSLGEIIPTLILDWHIQLEQLMAISFTVKHKKKNNTHDLEYLSKEIGIDTKLSEATKSHLASMNMAILWSRYPVSSKRYHISRQTAFPLPLMLILRSHRTMTEKYKLEHKDIKVLLNNLLSLYSEHVTASAEIMQVLSSSSSAADETAMTQQWIEKQKQKLAAKEDFTSIKTEDHHFQGAIFKLYGMQDELKSFIIKNKNSYHISSLKEGIIHIRRLIETLRMCDETVSDHQAAWVYRGYLKVQQVFEQLYIARCLNRGLGQRNYHHLFLYHDLLKDPAELSGSHAFSFGKQIHYTNSVDCGTQAAGNIKVLQELAVEMHSHITRETSGLPDILGHIQRLVDVSVPILKLHIDACKSEVLN